MNMSLKENNGPSPYGACVVKRKKAKVDIAKYEIQPAGLQDAYRLVQQSPTPTRSSIDVVCLPHHGSYRSERELMGLGGKWYEEIARIVAGNIESITVREAVDESIEDGRINFDRLATWISRKEAAGKFSDANKFVRHFFVGHNSIQSVNEPVVRIVIISIFGALAERTPKQLTIDWYGGGKLTIARSRAEGDWDQLQVGDWLEATVSRKTNGEVVRAMLLGTVEEPRGFSEEELADSYSSIPAASLDPVE